MSMNVFAIIILAALILEFTLELVTNLLNVKALKLELPPALEGIYQAEEYRKSQEYLCATTRFGLVGSAFTLFVLLAFWFSGGFNYFDQVVVSWGFASIVNGLLYIGILLLAYGILTLPFSIYGTFVIEERFAAETIDDPRSLIDALKKLSAKNLSNLTPHLLYVFLNQSHPPLLQRVQAIQGIKPKNEVALD